jgi:hypothetical protein
MSQRNRMLLSSLVRLDQHHQLTEDLAKVTAVDFVNDEHVRFSCCFIALCCLIDMEGVPSRCYPSGRPGGLKQ